MGNAVMRCLPHPCAQCVRSLVLSEQELILLNSINGFFDVLNVDKERCGCCESCVPECIFSERLSAAEFKCLKAVVYVRSRAACASGPRPLSVLGTMMPWKLPLRTHTSAPASMSEENLVAHGPGLDGVDVRCGSRRQGLARRNAQGDHREAQSQDGGGRRLDQPDHPRRVQRVSTAARAVWVCAPDVPTPAARRCVMEAVFEYTQEALVSMDEAVKQEYRELDEY